MPEDLEIIRLEGVTKRFGGLTALDGVSFGIARGEVHAIVGENGAGKSTLMKMLAGVERPDAGRILLDGAPVEVSSPLEARRRGISTVFQELNLFPHLTVAANIFASRERVGRLGLLDERSMAGESREVLEALGVEMDPRARVSSLSVAERQIVEIARTLAARSSIVILDEPNSALPERESARLFEIIRRLRARGVTILYVSHRLDEVFALADRITVLRDGRHQGTWRAAETDAGRVVAAMIGRSVEEAFPAREPVPRAAPAVLEVRNLVVGGRLGPVSFDLRAGEVLGLAGLEGSGVDLVFHALFGLAARTSGQVRCLGSPAPPRSPADAIRLGVGLIPRSRREEGLVMDWPVRKNATLLILGRLLGRLGLIDRRRELRTAEELVRRLDVGAESLEKRVAFLSGGNQQKVVLAKWLAAGPRVLLLHDPTRGIDVGAKAEIYRLCRELVLAGLGILFTSSEIDETLGISDRVLAVAKGRIAGEYPRGAATKAEVLEAIAGGAR
ncbi:MAG TPA: sugar ABC transporter ATP-binding protein [Planctomycetota bacterium]|nr:sugar ABC transporter ATP-binding protein [Planctomycetota bacterium]